MLAATGWCGRGVGDAAPYGGKVPVLSLRGPVRPVAIRFPLPFLMFSNSNLKTPQFSILNFHFAAGGVRVAVNDRRYGGCGRGVGDAAPYGGKLPILFVGTARSRPAFGTNAICRWQI